MALNLTAARILSTITPEKIFSAGVISVIKKEYIDLSFKWHPDRCSDPLATDVMAHINLLKKLALDQVADGVWVMDGKLSIISKTGAPFSFSFYKKLPFELGTMYLSETLVCFEVAREHEALVKNFVKISKSFTFASPRMKTEMERFLPKVAMVVEGEKNFYLVISKEEDQLLLSEVIEFYGGAIDQRHAAWITSGILNICCYLKNIELVHGAINTSTIFINPEKHDVSLLGGWFYASKLAGQLVSLPNSTITFCPASILTAKKAVHRIDTMLARVTCRAMLGDLLGTRLSTLVKDSRLVQPLASWLGEPSKENSYDEYANWQNKVLVDSFGKRTFTKMSLAPSDIYDN